MAPLRETPSGRLRSAVHECHARLDESDYAAAVRAASLPIAGYASFLRAVYAIHDGLEQLVERSSSPALRAAFASGPARRERLERDLEHLRTDKYGVDAAALHALVLVRELQLAAQAPRGAAHVLGALYVVEGSQLGGLAQARALGDRPELQGGGLSYLRGLGAGTSAALQGFFALLDENLQDEAELAAAIEGARQTFAGFGSIMNAVMSDPERLAEALNSEAGAHPVARDLRELRAALTAGEQTWRDFSYYAARYGERGRRFTRSDSAWLVTLARLPKAQVLRQVAWLARVLAARGMPRLLLERHLMQLHAQLVAELPANRAEYHGLLEAAHALADERRARMPDARLKALAAELESALQRRPHATSPIAPAEAGLLLVAAVLDEACGVPHAVDSLCRWLTDTARASRGFCQAVEQTLHSARAAL